jgi:hypothetical protein
MFKRQRYQFGSVERKARKKGPDVWALRYREHLLDGTNCHKSLMLELSHNTLPSPKPGGRHRLFYFGSTQTIQAQGQ